MPDRKSDRPTGPQDKRAEGGYGTPDRSREGTSGTLAGDPEIRRDADEDKSETASMNEGLSETAEEKSGGDRGATEPDPNPLQRTGGGSDRLGKSLQQEDYK